MRLVKNVGISILLQIASIGLPLMMIPHLTSVLGADGYGAIFFAMSVAQLVLMLTDYGFNLSATYYVAKNFDDKSKIVDLFGAINAAKLILVSGPVIIISLLLIVHKTNYIITLMYWWMLAGVLLQTFLPAWLFQGLERFSEYSLIVLVSKVINVCFVLTMISGPDDMDMFGLAYFYSNFFALILIYLILAKNKILPKRVRLADVRTAFADSTPFFISRVCVSTYTSLNGIVLASFGSFAQVGFFGLADQIYRACQTIANSIIQVLYPHIVKNRDIRLLYLMMVVGAVCAGICLISVAMVFKSTILGFVGHNFEKSYWPVLILLLALTFNIPSMLIGYPGFGAIGRIGEANKTVYFGSVISLILLALLILLNLVSAVYIALLVMLVEASVFFMRMYKFRKIIASN